MQGKYRLAVTSNAKKMFSEHVRFLNQECPSAADRLVVSYKKALMRIADNPFQFPVADELDIPGLPSNIFRKCLFEDRYKALFRLEEKEVFIVSVVDSRRENKDVL